MIIDTAHTHTHTHVYTLPNLPLCQHSTTLSTFCISQEVSNYVDRAEEVEIARLTRVGAETTRLVDTLVSIAFMLPNEVERCEIHT